jgi:tRNA(Ile)-lysidine synthase
MGKAAPPSPVVAALREFFARRAGRTLLAVSGGVDSLALLTGAAEVASDRVGVASLDHGLRPSAAAEVEGVRALAERLGFPFHTAQLGLRPGPAMEARARQARYAALERIRASFGYAWIATAHTRDDQAETLLMRLARGTALRGAGAIRGQAGRVVRPLLGVGRADVEADVAARGLKPVHDPSNQDASLLRARIRASVLPALVAAAGPAAPEKLAAFAAQAAEDEGLLAEQAGRALERARVAGGLDAVALRSLPGPLRRRALLAFLAEAGIGADARLLGRAEAAIERGARTGLPGHRLLRSEGGLVRIASAGARPEQATLPEGRWVRFGRFHLRREATVGAFVRAFSLGSVAGEVGVRGRRKGDRVEGSAGQHRAVQDVLVDARVPAEERDAWPLLVDGAGRVIWVVALWPPAREGVVGPAVRAEPTSASPGDGL